MSSIIDSCLNIKHKAMLMVAYSSGLRVSEVAALKMKHIDSKDKRLFVEDGKGGVDYHFEIAQTGLILSRKII